MYGEPFDIPTPEEVVFISWFEGGEVLRSGGCWTRGSGRIFHFSPGHELYPIYHHPQIQRVIANTIQRARPRGVAFNGPRQFPIEHDPRNNFRQGSAKARCERRFAQMESSL